jgi:short subunit dehydrogenase-like uncharacterized protein
MARCRTLELRSRRSSLITIREDAEREEKREERRLLNRENQLNKRHDKFFHWPQQEKLNLAARVIHHIGCAALPTHRRTFYDRIAKRSDATECYAYLQDIERRCLVDALIEEQLLGNRPFRKPGDQKKDLYVFRRLFV